MIKTPNMDNYTLIRNAIIYQQNVSATYNGYYREMCPHVIGSKNGRRQALFYQYGGQSSSGRITPGALNNWRCIPVDDLQNVTIIEGQWHTASNHSTPSTCVDIIDVEVSF